MSGIVERFVRSKTVALQTLISAVWLLSPDARDLFCNHSTLWVLAHCGLTILARVIQPARRAAEIRMIKGDKIT